MTAATTIASPASRNRTIVTVCVMAATLMQALDLTIANVTLPYMQGSLAATASSRHFRGDQFEFS